MYDLRIECANSSKTSVRAVRRLEARIGVLLHHLQNHGWLCRPPRPPLETCFKFATDRLLHYAQQRPSPEGSQKASRVQFWQNAEYKEALGEEWRNNS
mmetsp:Transcript_6118/g.12467  ORF Transcript_6118/g.12467 Transcript_6118/m.12467 type:complete len:98 (+) Transcript_6118:89-382(+)